MKKVCALILLMGASSLHGMKKIQIICENSLFNKYNNSFFKNIKKNNINIFLGIQRTIKGGFNSNQSPKEIKGNVYRYFFEYDGFNHRLRNESQGLFNYIDSQKISLDKLSEKMLLFTMAMYQPLSYLLEEMHKFGFKGEALAGLCVKGKIGEVQKFIVTAIDYYERRWRDSDRDSFVDPSPKIKEEILKLLETSEALKIAQEQNDKILEETINYYYQLFEKKLPCEALKIMVSSYFQMFVTLKKKNKV